MALDRDELNKRRQQREALRKKRQAEQRTLMIRLVIAAVVLLLVGALVFALSRGNTDTPTPETTLAQQEDPVETTVPRETEAPTTVIHLAAAGDLNVTDKVVASSSGDLDYTAAFRDVLPLLASADLTVMNFEANLVGMPYGSERRSAPQSLVQALDKAGVDILQMANSWSIHNGINGLVSTLQTIRQSGIEPVGAYGTRDEFRQSGGYTIRDVNGIKVGIVAFTKGMNSMALPSGSENCVNLLYTDYSSNYQNVDTKGITGILEDLQEERPDITVAMLHWGSEVNDQISSSQKKIANLMFSEGVDVIIGTHPHYVQSILFDEEAGTFIAYSLGDFFGDASQAGTEYSIILDLEITKDNETGVTKVTGYDYTPIFTVHEEGKPLRVARIREAMAAYSDNFVDKVSDQTYHDMEYALGRIEARVNTPVK